MLTSVLLFLNMGTPELMLIMFAILLLFGGKKLPELARGLGKGIREFKDASDGVKREIQRNINDVSDTMQVETENKYAEPTTPQNEIPETIAAPIPPFQQTEKPHINL
ncbi:Twin-arginine translocation protein TatA [Arcticibacter svalbardensis MN12-7]|uniref:Sec-independent protein translocase protein TatA n=1 Tax=Arcticibacter svalbardensis MN12-7 TaxID=1150600 RepID=R9GTI7_9SPHI|nr:twin-arginine translocase TatA/TatE family subunit [Arcticibacter svalbardensis]EOR95031.1 Twin-arginine translocation protein TatA [Arcticibacter svalbardensis MN12-7]